MALLKTTPLSQIHREAGAKMVEFAGFDMPLHYTNLRQEHMAVRNHVGMFDISHMGEFVVSGPESEQFLQWMLSNDIAKMKPGEAQYNYLPNLSGGIVDDLVAYRFTKDKFLLVVNAANIAKDLAWLTEHNTFDCTINDRSEDYCLLAIQGPDAARILQPLTDVILSDIAFYHFALGTIAGIDNVLISATGYTGSGGFELYVPSTHADKLWKSIATLPEMSLCGLGCRDTLRMEKGYCLYGNDIDDHSNPYEAGLGWITKLKNKENIAKDILQDCKQNTARKLVGFVIQDKRIARSGATIYDAKEEKTIGVVTSGTHSPSLDVPIGLAYIDREHLSETDIITIDVGRKNVNAVITKMPLV